MWRPLLWCAQQRVGYDYRIGGIERMTGIMFAIYVEKAEYENVDKRSAGGDSGLMYKSLEVGLIKVSGIGL